VSVDEIYFKFLKDIKWKDINVKNNNDFDKTRKQIDELMKER